MANLQGLLGTMMATGMAGRSARGPAFASGLGGAGLGGGYGGTGGGFGQAAGLASLGYLAYKAYQQYQAKNPAAQPTQTVHGGARSATGEGRSLGDRMADMLSRGPTQEEPAAAIGDDKALLLIRAMVAAAAADGEIDADERRQILGRLEAAGAGDEERRLLERELADPPSLDDIVAGARDPETAEQVYLAARTALTPDGPAERSWLNYLADRLNLKGDRLEALRQSA